MSHLKYHTMTHTRKKPFQCALCDAVFSTKSNLNRHAVTHTGEKPFQCDLCDATFTQKNNLQQHVVTHTGEKPFKCDQCDAAFVAKCHLKRHMVTHTGEKSSQCDLSLNFASGQTPPFDETMEEIHKRINVELLNITHHRMWNQTWDKLLEDRTTPEHPKGNEQEERV
ncbi:uncharacterized protein LOC143030445 [Oratosquilla oratoria]|uniref:uncharacterized protein LOC143030445 n=1 Tax=Oratosquilla oratoria TaxID=337810 RepID=UPI003F76EC55